jgi:hypothetical protein
MSDTRQSVVDLIFGRWRSQILYAGVRLGVFDALGGGPKSSADLAEELRLDASLAYRLLRALGCLGLLNEDRNRQFSLTASGEFLRADHPQTLRGLTLLEEGPEHYAVWKHLCAMVREGKQDGFVREFGHPVFAHIAENRGYRAVFNEAMSSYSAGETGLVLEALAGHEFAGISHVCDIGGGHGHLLCNLLAKRTGLRGTVYELNSTIAQNDLLWAGKFGVDDRCSYVGGDMFEQVPSADAYLLKHILHDWNDAECIQILSNMRNAASPGARAFVAEFVVPGPETPHFAKLFDIHMMCATSGAERTEDEYVELFERSGWKYIRTWYPASQLIGVLEAVKA